MSLDAAFGVQVGTLDLCIDLAATAGELVAFLGPNGAGKTTALRCLAGLVAVDDGHIRLDDVVLDEPSSGTFVEPERRPVGVMFQDYLLFAHLTTLENVAFGLRARGIDKHEARARAGEWLERMGLSAYASQRPPALSGGQAQRVALARALATDPQLLLLDEPLAALDAGARAGMRRDLRRHLESFSGVRVLVTHDPIDAYALADRIAVIEDGRIAQAGTIAEVTAHPRSRYVADLVGTNLVSGIVSGGVLTTASGVRVVTPDAPAGEAFAVIRPQSISLHRAIDEGSSQRNVWQGTITDVDHLGDRVRVGFEGPLTLTAEITFAALEALALRPGQQIYAAVKATEIDAYPA